MGLDHGSAGHQFPLTRPEEGKDQTGKLLLHPGRHVHKRSHVPDPGESQSVYDEGLPAKSQGARTPGCENVVHSVYPRAPVVLLKIALTDENTQNLQFVRSPVQYHRGIGTTGPRPQPQAFGLQAIQLGTGSRFELCERLKNRPDGLVRRQDQRRVVGVLRNGRQRRETRKRKARDARIATNVP